MRLKEKEKLRLECEEIDTRHKKAFEDNQRYKTLDEELTMELEFLQEQVNESQLNEFKLRMRHKELKSQLRELTGEHSEVAEETDLNKKERHVLFSVRKDQKTGGAKGPKEVVDPMSYK